MNKTLEELYNEVAVEIARLDFDGLWQGFKPLKFALYNNEKCFFGGRYIEKPVEFCANTALEFQGEQIAIWQMGDDLETPVLTSKIVHEMFHAFQLKEGWACWANEMEALYKYHYDEENLTVKLYENRLLLELLEQHDATKYEKLLAYKKYRQEKFPYEFSYECNAEEIEGTATYVEWQVLKQLDKNAADQLLENMRNYLLQCKRFFPIRILGYYTGALLVHGMLAAKDYSFKAENRPVVVQRLACVSSKDVLLDKADDDYKQVSQTVQLFNDEAKRVVETAIEKNDVVLTGPYELVCVNIYDAMHYQGYLTSRFFVMYLDNGEQKVINGNFVIKMQDDKTIDKVYRWEA